MKESMSAVVAVFLYTCFCLPKLCYSDFLSFLYPPVNLSFLSSWGYLLEDCNNDILENDLGNVNKTHSKISLPRCREQTCGRREWDKWRKQHWHIYTVMGFLDGSVVNNLSSNVGDSGSPDSILGLGRSPGEGNGNPLQYSCLENSMDRTGWQATVHGIAKSWTWLHNWA